MKLGRRFYLIFKKEMILQSRFRLVVLARILIGPVVSLLSSGILFRGFFHLGHTGSFGEIDAHNYVVFLVSGFLIHSYLNHGYYFLSGKLIYEWATGTFPLLWMSPCSRLLVLAGLCSTEILRCLGLTVVAFALLRFQYAFPPEICLLQLLVLALTFLFGACLGWIKTCIMILNQGIGELLDIAYLGLIFFSFPYIPRSLLPEAIWPLANANPAYHACLLMRQLFQQGPSALFGLSTVLLILGASAGLAGATLFWGMSRELVQERSCV